MKKSDYEVTSTDKGTLTFSRTNSVHQVKFKGVITAMELRKDKNNKPFYSVYVLHPGNESPTKWNLFELEKGDGLKVGDRVVGHGVYYGENRRMVKHFKKEKPKGEIK